MLVFISYAHVDTVFANRLVMDLKTHGIQVWYDQDNIRTGQRWDKAIEDGLDRATALIFIMSPASVASENCRDEVDAAVSANKQVLPILIADCNPPLRVRRHQHLDF